jgi:hypothetical protein
VPALRGGFDFFMLSDRQLTQEDADFAEAADYAERSGAFAGLNAAHCLSVDDLLKKNNRNGVGSWRRIPRHRERSAFFRQIRVIRVFLCLLADQAQNGPFDQFDWSY